MDAVTEASQDCKLHEAFDALTEAVFFFDVDDRLLYWNDRYAQMLADSRDLLQVGISFETLVRGVAASGKIPEAHGGPEDWVAWRLRQHAQANTVHEQLRPNGRWIRVQESRTANGGTIGMAIDITELKQREASSLLLFEANPAPMYVFDRETLRITDINDAALALYGYSKETFLQLTLLDIRPGRDHVDLLEAVQDGSAFNYRGQRAWAHIKADGSEIFVQPYTRALTRGGRPVCVVALVDITERQRMESELRRTRAFLDSVIEAIPAGVFAKDATSGHYVLCNRAGEALIGRSREVILGRTDRDIFSSDQAEQFAVEDGAVVRDRCLHVMPELFLQRRDGETRIIATKKLPICEDPRGDVSYVLGISEDITDRRRMELRLDHMAHHDPLTGLPNRALFRKRLDQALRGENRDGVALLFIDLDGFKGVNDFLGHRVGDALLCTVASRLHGVLRSSDTAARLGGDEFVIIQSLSADPEDTARLAARLIAALSAAYDVEGHQVVIGASIGIAVSGASDTDTDADTLLRNADFALYRAKASENCRFSFFEFSMDRHGQARLALVRDLQRAFRNGEFHLVYQPFFDVSSGRVSGREALLRWNHPERGMIPPADFVQIAEEIGLIVPLGEWILREACTEAASWPDGIKVAVNLSPVQFKSQGLVAAILSALAASCLDPRRLELEITESVLLEDSETNLSTLHQLRALGLSVALDDFGTGYSSISYLRRFSFDKVKLDRSFVKDLPGNAQSLAIVRGIIAIASSLDMLTTAEGVETAEQYACLKAEGCLKVQGYLFGRPEPMHRLPQSLRRDGERSTAA